MHLFRIAPVIVVLSLSGVSLAQEVDNAPKIMGADGTFELTSCDTETLREVMREGVGLSGERDAEKLVAHCGEAGIPVFLECLRDPDPYLQARGAFCLGKSGHAEAAEWLIEFLEKPRGIMPRLERNSFAGAIYSLGFLGTEKSLDYARQMATEAYWKSRGDEPQVEFRAGHITSVEDARIRFRGSALTALTLSGKEAAYAHLDQLEKSGAFSSEMIDRKRNSLNMRITGKYPDGPTLLR